MTERLREDILAGKGRRSASIQLATPQPASRKQKAANRLAQKARRRGDDYNGIQPRDDLKLSMLEEADDRHGGPVVSSAKTTAVEKIVRDWQRDAPKDKIISKQMEMLLCRKGTALTRPPN